MSRDDILFYIRAILLDDESVMDGIIRKASSHLIHILKIVAVYFHAYKCTRKLTLYDQSVMYWSHLFKIATLVDNEVFFHDYTIRLTLLTFIYKRDLYYLAKSKGNEKVALFLAEHLSITDDKVVKPNKASTGRLTVILRNFKDQYTTLQDMWIMYDTECNNLVQWLPREILEEQLNYSIISFSEELYYYLRR